MGTVRLYLNRNLYRPRREGREDGSREDAADRRMDDSLELVGFKKRKQKSPLYLVSGGC